MEHNCCDDNRGNGQLDAELANKARSTRNCTATHLLEACRTMHNIQPMQKDETGAATPFQISPGFADSERGVVARLFWEAFRGKLGRVMGPDAKAKRFFEDIMSPDFALVARSEGEQILGIAGFKTTDGALAGGSLSDLRRHYGWFGGIWRGLLLNTLERDLSRDVLLMDGIFVDQNARGRGVGSALLMAVREHAATEGLSRVRLDVIDQNPRAKSLYERVGFRETGKQSTGPLKWIFGFSTSTTMELSI